MIRISILLFFCAATFVSVKAQEEPEKKVKYQLFRPFISAGFNAAQVDGDDLAGFNKFGFIGGIGTFIMLPKNVSVGMELLYSQKGSRSTKRNPHPEFNKFKLKLNYIELPLMLSYHDRNRAIFSLGIIINTLASYDEVRFGTNFSDSVSFTPYKTISTDIMGSVSFYFIPKLGINLRFAYSLGNIAKEKNFSSNLKDQTERNNLLTARLFYILK